MGKLADHPDDAGKFARAVMENMEVAKARFMTGMDLLRKHPTVDSEHIAAIGYCFGGGIVLHMARLGIDELDGVVSFHGSLSTQTPAERGDGESQDSGVSWCSRSVYNAGASGHF